MVFNNDAEVVANFKKIEKCMPLGASEIRGKNPPENLKGPGVYMWLYKNKVIYVGRTGKKEKGKQRTLHKRLIDHLGGGANKDKLNAQQVQKWVIENMDIPPGKEAKDWMRNNLQIKYLIVKDDEGGDYYWKRRFILEHYLIAYYEPEANIAKGQER